MKKFVRFYELPLHSKFTFPGQSYLWTKVGPTEAKPTEGRQDALWIAGDSIVEPVHD